MSYLAIPLCLIGAIYRPLAAIAYFSFAVQSWGNQYLLVSLLARCNPDSVGMLCPCLLHW
ncbi:hypothetical protein EON65_27710 [archaeon]|nr:MAG: hypothetical protein EON65_27710 [archaeon]